MNIVFKREQSDIAERLFNKMHLLMPQAIATLKVAFRHGGYIAGGFARILLRNVLKIYAGDEVGRGSVYAYLRTGEPLPPSPREPWWRAYRGDIDIFFPTRAAHQNFLKELSLDPEKHCTHVEKTITGAAVELECDNRTLVQAIAKFVGPIEDVLASFDIYNAMVAFNDKELIVADGWEELERESMLHVANWTSPYVIHRIAKWHTKQTVAKLSPATACELGRHAFDLIARFKKEPLEMPWGKVTHEDVIKKLKYYLPQLSNDDLVLLCSVYPIDAYGSAFSILRERMERAHPGRQISDDEVASGLGDSAFDQLL